MWSRVLIGLAICSCQQIATGGPGDEQSLAWEVPTTECQEPRPRVECDGGERRSVVIDTPCTILEDCRVYGFVRVHGRYESTHYVEPSRSREPGWVDYARGSTWGVEIRRVEIVGNGNLPLYISTGVTRTTVEDVLITGHSHAAGIYLESESGYNVFRSVTVEAAVEDDVAIAVDSSDHNRFIGVTLVGGGFRFYRNCGESGVTRVTTPSFNLVLRSTIVDADVPVWLGSRFGDRSYCGLDNGTGVGSSRDDRSHARWNEIAFNVIGDGEVRESSASHSNTILFNTPW